MSYWGWGAVRSLNLPRCFKDYLPWIVMGLLGRASQVLLLAFKALLTADVLCGASGGGVWV